MNEKVKLSFAEEINAEVQHIRARDKEKADAAGAAFAAQEKQISQEMISQAYADGTLVRPEILAGRAEELAIRAIAAKNTQDANGTWAITKSAMAAHKPEKAYVAEARASQAAAREAHQPSQSMGQKAR